MLFVFDPVALHNIIVKDQYVYEEAAWFIRYVCNYGLQMQSCYLQCL